MPDQPLPKTTLARLAQFDTPTICNVIELFALRPRNTGYMDARIRACYPHLPPAVGYASTAVIRTAFARTGGGVYSSLGEQVRRFQDLPGPAMVVFQDTDDPATAATFGEIMCSTYKAFGAAGLITSGAARDLDQVRALDFPCFSDGAICSHGYSHILSVHEPVRVGGLPVLPGDLMHADANGITNIPMEIAADVADTAPEYVAAEAILLDFLKTGDRDCARYAEVHKHCLDEIVQLGKRVQYKRASAVSAT